MLIKDVLNSESPADSVEVCGWTRTRRSNKAFSFIELNDGSCLKNIQVIVQGDLDNYAKIEEIGTGTSIKVSG